MKDKTSKRNVGALAVVMLCVLGIAAMFSACGSAEPEDYEEVLDLMALSMTVRNAEIQNLQTKPHEYVGRYISVSGQYEAVYSEILGRYRHFVLLSGGDSCCPSVVMEFVKGGDYTAPEEYEEYPELGATVYVLGIFGTYRHEGSGIMYQYLSVEEIEW